jgi:DNA-binding CsgD family transcriptional regulator
MSLSVPTQGVRRLLDLADPQHLDEPGAGLPESALSALMALVPCDLVTYQVHDAAQQTFVMYRKFGPDADAEPQADENLFWAAYWSNSCSYPDRSGDYGTVFRHSDPVGSPATRRSRALLHEYLRQCGLRHEVMIPLPPDDRLQRRVLLWRHDGLDFNDDEVLLLGLVRPHVVAIQDGVDRRRSAAPDLTPRQRQLLGLVAAGLTNRQIAGRTGVSEHTVRKHIENIFNRLQVNSRTAAVARAFPSSEWAAAS